MKNLEEMKEKIMEIYTYFKVKLYRIKNEGG